MVTHSWTVSGAAPSVFRLSGGSAGPRGEKCLLEISSDDPEPTGLIRTANAEAIAGVLYLEGHPKGMPKENGMTTETPAELDVAKLRARIAPIPEAFLTRVRDEGRDDLGQVVRRVRATGGEPCRDALRRALPGEELI